MVDIAADPQYRARDMLVDVLADDLTITVPGVVPKLAEAPGTIRHAGPVVLGTDNRAAYGPFAPGATGNVATEDTEYMLDAVGIATGTDRERLFAAADVAESIVGRPSAGHVKRALRAATS